MDPASCLRVLRENILSERATAEPRRPSCATDGELGWTLTKLEEAQRALEIGLLVQAVSLLREVARSAVDHWVLSAAVTEQVITCADRSADRRLLIMKVAVLVRQDR